MQEILMSKIKWTLLAQLSSVSVSIGLGLFLPKFINVIEYSYWQLFVLYSACFELLLLGVPNGFYLKNAGKEVFEYDYLKTAFCILMFLGVGIGIVVALSTDWRNAESFVYYLISLSIVFINSGAFLSLVLRAKNEIYYDSISLIALNIFIIVGLFILFISDIFVVKWVISIYIMAFFIRDILLVLKLRKLFKGILKVGKEFFLKLLSDSSVGVKLLLIDYTNILAFSICRLICKENMGMILFGYLSFAFSLVILLINFVNQLSMSILPSLRKLTNENAVDVYIKIRNLTSIFFSFAILLYKPAEVMLSLWLPQYSDAFDFILILFPLIIFDGKMQTVFNMFLKLFRKENLLLKINLVFLVISIITYFLVVEYYKDVKYVLFMILFFSWLKSTVVEIIVSRLFDISNFARKIVLEFLICIVFLFTYIFLDDTLNWMLCMIMIIPMIIYNYRKCIVKKKAISIIHSN